MSRLALYHFETLLWISRLGTFAAAADRLNTTQPSISARVREVENRVGTPIFRRDGRRMILTAKGRQLVRDCEPLWSALEQALLDAGAESGASGIVRIGAGEIAAASCLPLFLVETKALFPGVTLEVAIDLTATMLEQLLAGTRDIVFLAGPVRSPGIRTHAIGSVGLVWLAAPAVTARMAQEPAWIPPIWSLPRNSPLHPAMLAELAGRPQWRRQINGCNNVRMLIDIASSGGGLALLPITMVADAVKTGVLVEALPRPDKTITFEVAIRAGELDAAVLSIYERARQLAIDPAQATRFNAEPVSDGCSSGQG
jgi:DNA-binding transcriptional LysR family regulator